MPIRILEGPYRAGPWPGLTVRGALLILAHTLVLAAFAESWLPLTVLPMLSATWLMRMPGVASAVLGAYLLPRSLLSLFIGATLPPLLLPSAMAFDVVVWALLSVAVLYLTR